MSHRAGGVVVAHPLFQAEGGGSTPTPALRFARIGLSLANELLVMNHYLGKSGQSSICFGGFMKDALVCCQVWRHPAARMLPQDGSWLELCRWCMTSHAGMNAGSRMMGWVVRQIRREFTDVKTLVSYSDPAHGHCGSIYRASGWLNRPTHHEKRFKANGVGYPSGHGSWNKKTIQGPKQRWCIDMK